MSKPQSAGLDAELAERVEAANDALEKLSAQYRDWALNDVAQMREAIAQIAPARARGDGNAERAAIYKVYDIGHNAKGQGASFGYDLVTKIGASLCALLAEAETATPELLAAAAAHAEAMDTVLNENMKGAQGERGVMLFRRFGVNPPAEEPDDGEN